MWDFSLASQWEVLTMVLLMFPIFLQMAHYFFVIQIRVIFGNEDSFDLFCSCLWPKGELREVCDGADGQTPEH